MEFKIDLSPVHSQRLKQEADRRGVPPEELVRVAVIDLLDRPEEDFNRAAEYVLRKNEELYRRLS